MFYRIDFCNFFKKIRIFLVGFLFLIFGIFCTKNSVYASEIFDIKDIKIGAFTYNLDENNQTATITKCDTELLSSNVNIPEIIEYKNKKYTVKTIGGNGEFLYAIHMSKKVEKITGNSIEKIDDTDSGKFNIARNFTLKEISFPEVTYIGDYSFHECENLTDINIPKAIHIGTGAFLRCKNIKNINIPNVIKIGDGAFQSCENLTGNINLPKAIHIGEGAFSLCQNVKSVSIPSVSEISDDLFCYCKNLTDLNIDIFKVTRIGRFAFQNCESITSINIPNVIEVGEFAFWNCISLTDIDITKAVRIGSGAFLSCHNLTNINLLNVNEIGWHTNSSTISKGYAFSDCKKLKNIILPEVTEVHEDTFFGCINLENIIIPKVKYIYSDSYLGVFGNCSSLKYVEAPNLEGCDENIFKGLPGEVKVIFKVPARMKNFGLEKLPNSDKVKIIYIENNKSDLEKKIVNNKITNYADKSVINNYKNNNKENISSKDNILDSENIPIINSGVNSKTSTLIFIFLISFLSIKIQKKYIIYIVSQIKQISSI